MSQADIQVISNYLTTTFINAALFALAVYEYAITLEEEIKCVWRREFTLPGVLLIINRYCILAYTFLGLLFQVVMRCFTDYLQLQECNLLAGIMSGLVSVLFIVISSPNRYRIPVSLTMFLLSMVPFGADLYISSLEKSMPDPEVGGCVAGSAIDSLVNLQISSITADLILLIVTWIKTFGALRDLKEFGIQMEISQLMLRDGTLYFLVFLAMNLGQIVLFQTAGISLVAPFILPVTSILVSRFVLNLRWASHQMNRTSDVRFTPLTESEPPLRLSLLGNLGEPLHSDRGQLDCAPIESPVFLQTPIREDPMEADGSLPKLG
ncbi:hypothetical protein BDW22DRAFT_1349368 [Trametopsis cervina]|nr:hypothetical protein BDW22DRAFT_1349368 [Trametopsis cervina]